MTAATAIKTEALAGTPISDGAGASHSVPVATFTLPEPPSTNALFKNVPGRGRVRTSHYSDWLMCAITAMRMQSIQNVDCRCIVIVGVERNSLQADIDNRLKATLDAIVKAGVLSDDSLVTAALPVWLPKANAMAHVQIFECRHPLTLTIHPAQDGASAAVIVSAPQHEGDDDGYQPV